MNTSYSNIISRFNQFGGFRLLWSYLKLGMGNVVLHQGVKMLTGRATRDEAYAFIRNDVNQRLQAHYADYLKERKAYYDGLELKQKRRKTVWTCWLQGFEKAPEIVKICQASMRKWLTDREIIQLTYDNYNCYVKLPDFIVAKYEKGLIPSALFSDLLRLEVLIAYGGTWMDASILCTGNHEQKPILDCDLFMFQSMHKGDTVFYGISNWFITACSNNRLLMVLRDALVKYWQEHDVTLNYYIFHDFFYSIAQMYPKEISTMPRKNRLGPLQLMQSMGKPLDLEWKKEILDHVCFHKLSCRSQFDAKWGSVVDA